jgi:hypothetical protein
MERLPKSSSAINHDMSRSVRIGPKKQCRAKSKHTQERCKLNTVPESTVCRFHGGLTPRGRNSPLWKHGKYSKHLPSKVAPRYAEALADPELMSLKHDIAVTEARIIELMERIDSGEAGKVWDNLRKAGARFQAARNAGNSEGLIKAVAEIGDLVTKGSDEYEAYNEIKSMQEHRRKMTETENKMLIAKQQMISTEQFMQFIVTVVEVIQRHANTHVKEKTARTRLLSAVATDFDRLSVLEIG